jgi:hypothetical protein
LPSGCAERGQKAPWAALNRMTGLPEGADRTLGNAHLHGKMLRI